MTRSSRRSIACIAALALATAASGCAARAERGGFDCNRQWGMGTVGGALAGAAIGGAAGGGIAATSGETEKQTEDLAVGIGIGAATGALIGTFFGHCAFDERIVEREILPPPPRPAPPPPPPPPTRRRIILRGVNFDFDKATIRPDAVAILDEAVEILREQPGIDVSVDGHTDAVGSDEYNERLSERRARAVADYLARHGIDRARLQPRGFGESHPVASNDSAEGRAQNRRVELNTVGSAAGRDREMHPDGRREYRDETDDAQDEDQPAPRHHRIRKPRD
jgi:outer membrane protein OmpA-like peptidoglycan-associated protein